MLYAPSGIPESEHEIAREALANLVAAGVRLYAYRLGDTGAVPSKRQTTNPNPAILYLARYGHLNVAGADLDLPDRSKSLLKSGMSEDAIETLPEDIGRVGRWSLALRQIYGSPLSEFESPNYGARLYYSHRAGTTDVASDQIVIDGVHVGEWRYPVPSRRWQRRGWGTAIAWRQLTPWLRC